MPQLVLIVLRAPTKAATVFSLVAEILHHPLDSRTRATSQSTDKAFNCASTPCHAPPRTCPMHGWNAAFLAVASTNSPFTRLVCSKTLRFTTTLVGGDASLESDIEKGPPA